jgi:uncharacterized protein with HEPN domain
MSPDQASVVDIVVAGRNVATFIAGLAWDAFEADLKTQSAVQHQLIVLGEAAKRLSPEFRVEHEDIEWREVAGLRDVLTHAYHRVSLLRVWEVATEDVPRLLAYLEPLVSEDDD